MKFLDVLKKFDKCIVMENKKLMSAYQTLLKEETDDEQAVDVDEACCDEANKEEEALEEGEKCEKCGNDPCTCNEKEDMISEEDFFDEAKKDKDEPEDADTTAPAETTDEGEMISEEDFFDEAKKDKDEPEDADTTAQAETTDEGELVDAVKYFKTTNEENDEVNDEVKSTSEEDADTTAPTETTDEREFDPEETECDEGQSAADFFAETDDVSAEPEVEPTNSTSNADEAEGEVVYEGKEKDEQKQPTDDVEESIATYAKANKRLFTK